MTIRTHLRATVADPGTAEFGSIYGGEMTPEQFEAFEDARAESARIGWEPYMHNPSLPYLLRGVKNVSTLLVRGSEDRIVQRAALPPIPKPLTGPGPWKSPMSAIVRKSKTRPNLSKSCKTS